MPNIPVYSDMGESLEISCVCVCVNAWYAWTILVSFFRKDWACGVCVLEVSS